MKKLLLDGFDASVTEGAVRSWMETFGPVHGVDIFREGNATAPLVVVEMDIDETGATYLTSRITRYWHEGRVISAHLWAY
jgi:hypothetical protein